jgi:hypothetical protein
MQKSESIVKSGLENFIKKHYRIVFLKGILISFALLSAIFLLLIFSEYLLWLSPKWRFAIFWAFCSISAVTIVRYLLSPFLQYLGFRRKMNSEKAAELIGLHFAEVKDVLLNLLELEKRSVSEAEPQKSLILASVEQRYNGLKNVQFTDAVQFKEKNKYLLFATPVLAFLLATWLYNPKIISDGSNRLINYSEHFQKPLSFSFSFTENDYTVIEGESIKIEIGAAGDKIPTRIYLQDGSNKILFTKSKDGNYTAVLSNNFASREIFISAGPFLSKPVKVNVLQRPKIKSLTTDIKYPAYTKFDSEVNNNTLDLIVPEGSQLTWILENEKHTTTNIIINQTSDFQHIAKKSVNYYVVSANDESQLVDTLTYSIKVIADQYPKILAELKTDSLYKNTFYLQGQIEDDYGFSQLKVIAENSEGKIIFTKSLPLNKLRSQSFVCILDDLKDVANVYAKVFDNDQVNGPKFSVSQKTSLTILDEEALAESLQKDREEQINKIEKLKNKSEKINDNLEKLKDQLKGKKDISFEEKQEIKNINKEVKKLQDEIEKSKKENQLLNSEEERLSNFDEKILEKQQKLEELFEELIDPELEKLLNELQEMMNEENKAEIEKALEDLKINNEDIEKSLDQNMEWLKQLALDKETEDLIKKLDELGKKQEELSEKETDTKEEQEQIDKEFEKIQEDIKQLDKKGDELKKPTDFQEKTKAEQAEIKKEQQKAQENMSESQDKKANDNQKKAGQKMQDMAEQMSEMKKSSEAQQQTEDMESLRAILENLIQLSFDEEELLDNVKNISSSDPKINQLSQRQKDIKDNFVIVEDSLQALASRVMQLAGIINKEISTINSNLGYTVTHLQDVRLPQSAVYQQKTMMGFNNLALLLDEVLKQMQMQMAKSQPGSGNCEKPGGSGSKPSLEQLRKMQEQMGKDMEGGKKPGKKGEDGQGMGGSKAKQIAKQAAQQAAIRRKIQGMAEELSGGKSGSAKKLQEIAEEMEKIEEDLVNKRPLPEIKKRQQEVLTRLLEAEKADLERELDKERESKSAKNQRTLVNEQREEYLRKKLRESEILKSYPTGLKPYYKNKTDIYFEP